MHIMYIGDKLFIFDLDGTLIDSVADLAAAGNHTLEIHGFPTHQLKEYYKFVGNGIGKLMERALPEGSKHLAESLLDDFRAYYNIHLADNTRPYPSISGLLAYIQSQGAKIAVASNKYQAATEMLVSKFFPDIRFCSIHGQRDGVARKPAPEVVFEIVEEAGARLSDVIYVGDSDVDMRTAANADVRAIGVTYGFCPAETIVSFRPWKIASSADEILDILRG